MKDNKIKKTVRIDKDVAEVMHAINEEVGIPLSRLVEDAMKYYINNKYPEYKKEQRQ